MFGDYVREEPESPAEREFRIKRSRRIGREQRRKDVHEAAQRCAVTDHEQCINELQRYLDIFETSYAAMRVVLNEDAEA